MTITGLEEFLAAVDKHRVVLLGECSLEIHEFYALKAQIVRRLVEEHGFSLLIFEAGMAACAQATSRLDAGPVDRLEGLNGYARTYPLLSLFKWWERADVRSRLKIVGMDASLRVSGADWIVETLRTLGYGNAGDVGATELQLEGISRRMLVGSLDAGDERAIAEARPVFVEALGGLASCEASYDVRLVERVLHEHLTMLDVTRGDRSFLDWCERRMAANVAWWCSEMHPGEKAIVWGHNHHMARHHSAIDGVATMGEYLPDALTSETFSLGLYAYSGTGIFPDRTPYTIPPAPPDSLECYGLAEDGDACITLFSGEEGWWNDVCMTRPFGIEEEIMIQAEQYDGVLVVRDVKPCERVDPELARRLPM